MNDASNAKLTGMDYQLDASGEMWAGVLFTLENGPAGWNNVTTNPKFPLHSGPAAHPYALIGRFGNDPYFYVGDGLSRRRYTGTTTKRLFLAINDDRPGNGTGAFLCRIQAWR